MSTIKSPEEFLGYKHEGVLKRFLQLHPEIEEAEATKIFKETMKFLFVCSHIRASSPPSAIVDEMWHIFILFTSDYFQFCKEYVGQFIHHQPTDKPYIGNRPEMVTLYTETFGEMDENYWYHLVRTKEGAPRNCSQAYCSENCNRDNIDSDIAVMEPVMGMPNLAA